MGSHQEEKKGEEHSSRGDSTSRRREAGRSRRQECVWHVWRELVVWREWTAEEKRQKGLWRGGGARSWWGQVMEGPALTAELRFIK